MKKIYTYLFLLVIMLFSCTKEIEFGTDFDFNVAVPTKTDIIYKDVFRDMEISLIDILSKSESTYEIDYEEIVGTINVKVDDFELLKGTYRELPFSLNKSVISVKPTTLGLVTFKLKVKNNLGLIKEFTVQLNVVEFPNTYDFEAKKNTVGNPLAGATVDIGLIITNTGNPIGNSYRIKYSTSLSGVFKIGSLTLNSGEYNPIDTGVTGATYTSTVVGEHKISITVINLQGTEKKIDIIVNYLPNPVRISFPQSPLNAKEILEKSFEVEFSNLISTYNYQIKITSTQNAQIKNQLGELIVLDNYVPLDNKNGTFIYKYLTNQSKEDLITIFIKDQNGFIVTQDCKVIVNPKPVVLHVTTTYTNSVRNIPREPTEYSYTAFYNIDNITVGNGETITAYYVTANNTLWTALSLSFSRSWGPTPWRAHPYTVRVMDSSGRWSENYTGIWGNN